MKRKLAIVAVVAGLVGFLLAGTEFSSSDPNIIASAFLVLCALLSIALGVAVWRKRKEVRIFDFTQLLIAAGAAGAVIGMALMVLAQN